MWNDSDWKTIALYAFAMLSVLLLAFNAFTAEERLNVLKAGCVGCHAKENTCTASPGSEEIEVAFEACLAGDPNVIPQNVKYLVEKGYLTDENVLSRDFATSTTESKILVLRHSFDGKHSGTAYFKRDGFWKKIGEAGLSCR